MTHKTHRWKPHLPEAIAYYSKRNDEDLEDAIWVRGEVFTCSVARCEAFLFAPTNSGFCPVEAELVSIDWKKENEEAA